MHIFPPEPSVRGGGSHSQGPCQFFAHVQKAQRWLISVSRAAPPSLVIDCEVLYSSIWSAAAAANVLQSCPTLCDPIDGSPPGSHPWDSPGKNTGVGCHFLLQFMKVKVKLLSRVQLFTTPWAAAHEAPPSVGFSRQEYSIE